MSNVKQYRKKPVVIEAMHFKTNNDDGTCMAEIQEWVTVNNGVCRNDNTNLFIKTLEGEMRASVGDYIIKGVQSEFYPCKPGIFEATYEQL